MKQPFYEDTVIVITGDHLSIDKDFFDKIPREYQRGTYNLFLNANFKNKNIQTKNRLFTTMDYFPTILSSLGVQIDGDRLGLGTDLSSNKKTLIEENRYVYFDDTLVRNGDFYNETFIAKKAN